MVQFLSIIFFSWISSIFVGVFKSSLFCVSFCIALSHSHKPSVLYCHTGNAHNFYQFFKQELKLPAFNCVISRYNNKLSPYNLLCRIGITVQPGAQNVVASKPGPFPLAVMPDLFSVLTWLVVDCVWNMMAHGQKPDFVFRSNGQVHLRRWGRQFSWLLAAEVCAPAVVMLDTPCSELLWRVLATHSIRQFTFHFPSRVSPCAITFQLGSNPESEWETQIRIWPFSTRFWLAGVLLQMRILCWILSMVLVGFSTVFRKPGLTSSSDGMAEGWEWMLGWRAH